MGALLAFGSTAYAEGVVLRGFGGLNFAGDEKLKGSLQTDFLKGNTGSTTKTTADYFSGDFNFDSDTGYVLGAAIGYQWDNGLTLEVEAAYRRNGLDFVGTGTKFETTHFFTSGGSPHSTKGTKSNQDTLLINSDGHVEATSLMANVWYEFELSNTQWKPFIGGGIGMAWADMNAFGTKTTFHSLSDTDPNTDAFAIEGDGSGFAWQLGAGIGYEFDPGKQLTLEYRYFNGPEIDDFAVNADERVEDQPGDYDYDSHNVMIGMKFGL